MPRQPLITTDDWPEAELRGAVLAGDLVAVGACWASVAEPQDTRLRAASYAWSTDDLRLVAARRSAAWIWGVRSHPPLPHDVSVSYAHRVRNRRPGLVVREVAIDDRDVVRVGAASVTTPIRTAMDLLREPDRWDDDVAALVVALVEVVGVRPDELAARLAELRRAPMARRAERRLRELRLDRR